MLARRLLLVARGGGGFDVGYTMTADEVSYWQDMAALLDPGAYEYVTGTSQSRTVSANETWYLVNGWWLTATGGGGHFFHRNADIMEALPLTAGRTLTTDDGTFSSNGFMYLCKPSLVTGTDSRYTADPRGLFFDRLRKVGELTQYTIGATVTDTSSPTATFPGDFDNGLVIQSTAHDVAWTILLYSSEATGLNLMEEVSDVHGTRFARRCLMPFVRTTFPKIKTKGVNEAEGRGTVTYLKLPVDW